MQDSILQFTTEFIWSGTHFLEFNRIYIFLILGLGTYTVFFKLLTNCVDYCNLLEQGSQLRLAWGHCWYGHLIGEPLQRLSASRKHNISENVVCISTVIEVL